MQSKHIPWLIVIFLVGCFIGGFISSSFWIGLFTGIICGVVFYLWSKQQRKEQSRVAPVEKPSEPEPEKKSPDISESLEGLVNLNLMIRNDPHRDGEIVEKTEAIIDKIKTLLPEVNERFPTSPSANVLKDAASVYLMSHFKTYLGLSLDQRVKHKDSLLKILDELSNDLSNIQGAVTRNQVAEFRVKLRHSRLGMGV